MRTPQQILVDLRHTTEWSQPNVRYNEFMSLIDELESVLSNVKSTIEKTEKPSPTKVEEVVETTKTTSETIEKVVEAPKAKTTTSKK